MENMTHNLNTNLRLVKPAPISGVIQPEPPERLGPRVLEMMGVLQTTLEVEQQIALFTNEARRSVNFDGIEYLNEQQGIHLLAGETAMHNASYQITIEKDQLGQMLFHSETPWSERELSLMENLLVGLVYPLRNALRYRAALESAYRDPLTGAQNRAALDQAMQRESQIAQRNGTQLSMLMIDADHFKRINDTCGHAFGDDVLKSIAHVAQDTIRGCDQLFRYGGEEFVVLLSHTDRDGAAQLAERIRQRIDAIDTISGRDVNVSVSVGVTEWQANDNPQALFERADRALYQAKQQGRNQVVLA